MLSKTIALLGATTAVGATMNENRMGLGLQMQKLEKETLGPIAPYCKKTNGYSVTSTEAEIKYVYEAAKADFNALIDGFDDDKYEEFHKSNIFGNMLRGAFHDCGEFDASTSDNYGCDGCLSNTEANAGLIEDDSVVMDLFEGMWQNYCDKITRADYWALMGKFVAEKGDKKHRLAIPYSYGRPDNTKGCTEGAEGRLPGHQIGFSEFKRVFVKQMQLSLHDTIALQGGHTYGHVHREYSGFGSRRSPRSLMKHPTTNAWDETPAEFDNEYFDSLVNEPWINVQRGGDRSKNFWLVKEKGHELTIMLNADMEIAFFSNHDEDHARSPKGHIGINGELCATDAIDGEYGCFHKWKNNPGKPGWPETYDQCAEYIESNELFLKDWEEAYSSMITVGFSVDGYAPAGKSTKLGDLKSIVLPYYFGELGSEDGESEEEAEAPAATVTVETGSGDSATSLALGLAVGGAAFGAAGAGLIVYYNYMKQKSGANEKGLPISNGVSQGDVILA